MRLMRDSMYTLVACSALSLGCSCPAVPCEASIEIALRSSAWSAGEWSVAFRPDVEPARCTVRVVNDGVPPSPVDVTCDGFVAMGGFVQDTGMLSPEDPLVLRLRASAGARPAGLEMDLGSRVITAALDWREVRAPAGTCFEGCRTAAAELWLEGAPP
jgi:hypothetical protein